MSLWHLGLVMESTVSSTLTTASMANSQPTLRSPSSPMVLFQEARAASAPITRVPD
jgi:hypothetical protein